MTEISQALTDVSTLWDAVVPVSIGIAVYFIGKRLLTRGAK